MSRTTPTSAPTPTPAADAPTFHFASPHARLVVFLDGLPVAAFHEGRFSTTDAALAERLAALDCCHAVADHPA